ncbi:MAG: DUF2089 domain-containing protein [Bacteroidales bacterium]|nr:DUF2089 domain-containing protein [Bacteroidales bacterium]
MNKRFPRFCPSCQSALQVKNLACSHCSTSVEGVFELPVLACLSEEDQLFVLNFIKSSGSLKEMAGQLKLSYPTVRNMLDDVIERIVALEKKQDYEH